MVSIDSDAEYKKIFWTIMDKIDFKISLLLAPLAYAIHHIEEPIIFNFRAWRLIYFPDNNPLPTVLSIIMAVTLFYIIYH
ncbi:MAG: hypothetical protein EU548_05755 [Promethearchaeota archaeon]|nr:MAG: hypothetical protein EU548_05755 [Candidatus Lokiarchaeota archaeon]